MKNNSKLLILNWKVCNWPELCHADGLWQCSYTLQAGLWNQFWWQEFCTCALWWALLFSPSSPQQLGDTLNISHFREGYVEGLGKNSIFFFFFFLIFVACCKMEKQVAFHVLCTVSFLVNCQTLLCGGWAMFSLLGYVLL